MKKNKIKYNLKSCYSRKLKVHIQKQIFDRYNFRQM